MPVENYNSNDLGHEFYKFLSANYLLKTHPEFDADMEWEIKEQANVQVNFAERMLYLFKTKDPVFFKLCMNLDSRAPAEHKTFKKERKWIPFALLVNRTLPQYETLKRCLLFALDSDKLGLKKTSITYGQIINQLQHQHGMELRIVKALDNELRNIIAHGSWYVKEGKFVYLNS